MIQKLKDLKYRLHLMRRERTNAQKRRELTKNGIVFGAGTYCDPSSTIMPKVVMGTNCFVNKETLVGAHTTLGNNVFLGPRVTIFADTHEIGSAAQRAGANITRPVHIKNGTWVGQNAVITAGVTIGEPVPWWCTIVLPMACMRAFRRGASVTLMPKGTRTR